MPRFVVPVVSENALDLQSRLDAVGIGCIGPAAAGFPESDASWTVSDTLRAVIDAESAEAAAAEIRRVVGEGPKVGPAETFD